MDVNKLLDKCKEVSSCPTDMAMAEKLKVTRACISEWRHGKRLPNIVTCARISDITGIAFHKIVADIEEQRAISNDEKRAWRRLAQVAVLIMCTMPIASVLAAWSGFTSHSLYIMSIAASAAFMFVSVKYTHEYSRTRIV